MSEIEKEKILTPYSSLHIKLLIDLSSGEVFVNQTELARLCNKARSTVQHWMVVEGISNHKAKALTNGGVQDVVVYDEAIIAYALAKYNPTHLAYCAKAGLRVYLHGLVGIKYEPRQNSPINKEASETSPKALNAAKYSKEILELLGESNPRLAQYLVDHCINEVLGDRLTASENEKTPVAYVSSGLLGVVEIAEKLGYQLDTNTRSVLGKHVKQLVGHLGKIEKRLCNGRLTNIWVYPDCELVQQSVKSFFEQ